MKLLKINAALCDEVSEIGQKISRIETEKMYISQIFVVHKIIIQKFRNNALINFQPRNY